MAQLIEAYSILKKREQLACFLRFITVIAGQVPLLLIASAAVLLGAWNDGLPYSGPKWLQNLLVATATVLFHVGVAFSVAAYRHHNASQHEATTQTPWRRRSVWAEQWNILPTGVIKAVAEMLADREIRAKLLPLLLFAVCYLVRNAPLALEPNDFTAAIVLFTLEGLGANLLMIYLVDEPGEWLLLKAGFCAGRWKLFVAGASTVLLIVTMVIGTATPGFVLAAREGIPPPGELLRFFAF